jgi:hypothetical protein
MENEPDMRRLADFIGEALTKTAMGPVYPSLLTTLTEMVRKLMHKDFNQLVALLYEVDVDEENLRQLLNENKPTDVARVIAALLIERQEAKIKTRQQYKRDTEIDEEEKW